MNTPTVINILDDTAVLEQLKQVELYEVFMAQLARYPMEPDSIVRMKLWKGTDLYYFSYHHDVKDRGFLLTLIHNATREIEEIIDETNRAASRKQDQILYVDSPELRN